MSSPGKKWTARLGASVRRSSPILSVSSRPTTPYNLYNPDPEDSKVDVVGRPVTPTAAVAVISHPSPIAESPTRDGPITSWHPDNAQTADILQPISSNRSLTLLDGSDPSSGFAIVADGQSEETTFDPAADYTPPPLIDSRLGNPGAFTDDPDELPPVTPVVDPFDPSGRWFAGALDGTEHASRPAANCE